jgi:hypothetical protein
MNIRRPQKIKALSRRLMWWQLTKRFRAWRQERYDNRIKASLERQQQSLWANRLGCIKCGAVVALNAKYCQECGTGLPTTEPLIQVPPLLPPKVTPTAFAELTKTPLAFARAVRQQSGHNMESQVLKAVGQAQLAQLKAKIREEEGQK